jgi:hypothetical protein
VAVGVIDRHKQHYDVLEQVRARFCDCNVAQQGEPSIFPIGLACVNARLYQDYRLASASGRIGCEGFALGGD